MFLALNFHHKELNIYNCQHIRYKEIFPPYAKPLRFVEYLEDLRMAVYIDGKSLTTIQYK